MRHRLETPVKIILFFLSILLTFLILNSVFTATELYAKDKDVFCEALKGTDYKNSHLMKEEFSKLFENIVSLGIDYDEENGFSHMPWLLSEIREEKERLRRNIESDIYLTDYYIKIGNIPESYTENGFVTFSENGEKEVNEEKIRNYNEEECRRLTEEIKEKSSSYCAVKEYLSSLHNVSYALLSETGEIIVSDAVTETSADFEKFFLAQNTFVAFSSKGEIKTSENLAFITKELFPEKSAAYTLYVSAPENLIFNESTAEIEGIYKETKRTAVTSITVAFTCAFLTIISLLIAAALRKEKKLLKRNYFFALLSAGVFIFSLYYLSDSFSQLLVILTEDNFMELSENTAKVLIKAGAVILNLSLYGLFDFAFAVFRNRRNT